MFTLFYHESFNSQLQLAKYVGDQGYFTSTGEKITCNRSQKLIINPFLGQRNEGEKIGNGKWSSSILNYLFNCYSNDKKRKNKIKIIKQLEFEKGNDGLDLYDSHQIDIQDHQTKYESCREYSNGNKIVLYGVSKGASTTFNSIAINKFTDISLVILESCLYSTYDLLQRKYGFFSNGLYMSIGYFLPNVIQKRISPASMIEQFPEGIPVAFVTSKADKKVYKESTEKLAMELHQKGKNPVYLLILEKSGHGNYTSDDKNDIANYKMFVNALYKKYGSQFDPMYSTLGECLVDNCLLK